MDVFTAYSASILPTLHAVTMLSPVELQSKLTLGQEPAVRWAQRHSAGKFCHGDGRNLTWLPEVDGWINGV